LQDQGISYIAVDEAEQELYVFCQKTARLRDRRMFEAANGSNVAVVLVHGGLLALA